MNAPSWPSVEEQLKAAQVIRGSALEQLIRDNQDANLLRPDERPDDAVGLPLWIRVYYRKTHPNVQMSAVDPAGGYPDVLHNALRWMLEHQDLPWGSPTQPVQKGGGRP
jgi:hypothetical protein